ncbi:MAG: hypothetical protein FWD74_04000 [Actinomycetia bacterium]|nr:hypothetical protein [Actinomycetes bacterium]
MANPFQYGGPVSGEYFTGRTEELRALTTRMVDGINVVLMSPRRYGKTSLLMRAVASVGPTASVASVNAMAATGSPARFASALLTAVYHSKGGAWHKVRNVTASFVSRLRARPMLTVDDSGNPTFTFAESIAAPDPAEVITDAYGLMASTVTPDRAAVLIVDEFQDILDFGRNLPGLFKALADQYPRVALVISGSDERMLSQLTQVAAGPLFGMMQPIHLGPIPVAEMSEFIQSRFLAGGKQINAELVDRVVETAGPTPNDIQHLAYEVFSNSDREVTAATVAAGLASAVEHAAASFADTLAQLSARQRRLLAALAASAAPRPSSASFVAGTGFANASGVRTALHRLVDLKLVALRDGVYVVADPFIRAWLRDLTG